MHGSLEHIYYGTRPVVPLTSSSRTVFYTREHCGVMAAVVVRVLTHIIICTRRTFRFSGDDSCAEQGAKLAHALPADGCRAVTRGGVRESLSLSLSRDTAANSGVHAPRRVCRIFRSRARPHDGRAIGASRPRKRPADVTQDGRRRTATPDVRTVRYARPATAAGAKLN